MKKLFNTYESFVMVFKDQADLEKAIQLLQSAEQEIIDIQSPHFIQIKNLKPIKKHINFGIISGISGVIGCVLISLLIFYVMSKPHLLLGNKGALPIMAYIPILFTVSILFSGLGLLLTFGIKNHLLPGQQNQITDKLTSCEHYLLIIQKKTSLEVLKNMIPNIDILDIYEHKFIEQNFSLPLPLKIK